MNNKFKTALFLLALGALTACDSSDDTSTASSKNYITAVQVLSESVVEETEETEEAEEVITAVNLLSNGDFENWTDTQLDGWSTIDTGITVLQNVDTYNEGTSSAEVSVNTGSQGDTDFRQSIDVVSGKTYLYTISVYHTLGTVKARLFVDGDYPEYSDSDLVNQWQTLTYSYTASEDKNIEIGLRFYDQTGFTDSEIVYLDSFSFVESTEEALVVTTPVVTTPVVTTPVVTTPIVTVDTTVYYASATDLTGLALKTALYNIVKGHTAKTYSNLWDFMSTNSLDTYYENDATILDMYSENPSTSDSYNFTPVTNQCGNYSGEGSCYNREHSFPKSWFDQGYPMYTDIHHLFATDGYVNGKRSNYPYGVVGTSTFVSDNGSKLGSASSDLGYTGTVFEPIDEFKGDFARAYFYMATRYEDVISTWEVNSDSAAAVLDSTSDYVYEEWVITMLKSWHEIDPVSQKEIDRNQAAYEFQGNRNPFIDHPEYVSEIWAD